jgi:hypothetical protein
MNMKLTYVLIEKCGVLSVEKEMIGVVGRRPTIVDFQSSSLDLYFKTLANIFVL